LRVRLANQKAPRASAKLPASAKASTPATVRAFRMKRRRAAT
jgi:hypothetical protein